MKRRFLTLVVLTIMVAGTAWSQVDFGVRAGINFQNMNGKYEDGDKLDNGLKLGFHAGVEADIPLVPDFYIQPGIFFSTKGASKFLKDAIGADVKASVSYIEVPVHFLYKPALGSGKVFIGFGPYFAYGISGKVSNDANELDIEFTNDIVDLDLDNFPLRPLDIGADIFFGYQFDFGFFAQINAQLGLVNLVPKFDGEKPEDVIKNTGFGLSLGYKF